MVVEFKDGCEDGPWGDWDERCALLLDVTLETLRSDPELRLCEGLRLIDAARTAVARFDPQASDRFESQVVPQMRRVLMERFGVSTLPRFSVN